MRIERIISGGQTGADRAGLDAAIAAGVSHGGWCPRGRLAEDGTIARCYRLRETESAKFAVRTERNVLAADVTLVFTFGPARAGSAATIGYARRNHRPWLHLDLNRHHGNEQVVERIQTWLRTQPVQAELWPAEPEPEKQKTAEQSRSDQGSNGDRGLILNIAGSRASSAPGIYARVFAVVAGAVEGKPLS